MTAPLRIGIDFDNTIICYDAVFTTLAKSWQLINPDFSGTKQQLRDTIRKLPDGDTLWQRLQGQAYGKLIQQATLFPGVSEFVTACNQINATLFVVSHKTEFGHFDESRTPLREAAREWLRQQGFFTAPTPYIPEENVYFATTREEKIARIQSLQCTHFIDDLVEVLDSPLFPTHIERLLFQPIATTHPYLKCYLNWNEIKHVIVN